MTAFAAPHHLRRDWTTTDKRQFWPAMAMTRMTHKRHWPCPTLLRTILPLGPMQRLNKAHGGLVGVRLLASTVHRRRCKLSNYTVFGQVFVSFVTPIVGTAFCSGAIFPRLHSAPLHSATSPPMGGRKWFQYAASSQYK